MRIVPKIPLLKLIAAKLASIAVLVLAAGGIMAQAVPTDAPGSRDPAGLKRYEGSWILGYELKQFSDFNIPLARVTYEPGFPKKLTVEGRHTRVIYVVPMERAPLEVMRNYENDLKAMNAEVLWKCAADECTAGSALLTHHLYGLDRKLRNKGQMTQFAMNFMTDLRYLAVKVPKPEGDIYVSIVVGKDSFDQWPETKNKVHVLVDVVETKPMDDKMVFVDRSAMKQGIEKDGKIALYGIYFDFNSTAIKPESDRTLEEIAKFLQADPQLRLYVVGHTDNVGSYEYNLDLSAKRAQAVVAALVSRYRIEPARVRPAGAAMLSPVAPNDSEAGRAKNRRVELVRM